MMGGGLPGLPLKWVLQSSPPAGVGRGMKSIGGPEGWQGCREGEFIVAEVITTKQETEAWGNHRELNA